MDQIRKYYPGLSLDYEMNVEDLQGNPFAAKTFNDCNIFLCTLHEYLVI